MSRDGTNITRPLTSNSSLVRDLSIMVKLTVYSIGSRAEERNQKLEIPEFVDTLHGYMLSNNPTSKDAEIAIWQSLTSCMKGSFLSRMTGKKWNDWSISSTHEYVPPFCFSAYLHHIVFSVTFVPILLAAFSLNGSCLFTAVAIH